MSERIDHAAEARKLIAWGEEWMGEEGSTDATNLATAIHTVTHATLALVEQQRIMNILKLDEMSLRSQSYEPPGTVREALGL